MGDSMGDSVGAQDAIVVATAAIIEAFRNRAHEQSAGGHLSCSQQISLSQLPAARPSASGPRSDARGWQSEVQHVLSGLTEEQVPKLVQDAKEGDVYDLLKALQHGCAPGTPKGTALCLSLAEVCIREPTATAGRRGREIFNFLSNQADMLGANDCATIVMAILEGISSAHENLAKLLELMPKLLLTASKQSSLKVKKMSSSSVHGDANVVTTYTGISFRDYVLKRLCGNSSNKWPKSLIVPLLTTIRDLHPDDKELKLAVRKVKRESAHLELQELPPLVYQLLLLSTHGHRQTILEMVLELFNILENMSGSQQPCDSEGQASQITESKLGEEELIHVEGTVIHHFVFAVRQDVLLAKELLHVLRVRQCALSALEVALLLSLARIDRYAIKANDTLRKAFLQDFAHQHKIKSSAWVSAIGGLRRPSDMRQLCAKVLRRSGKGWDHVVPAIVSFALSHLEWAAKKCSAGGGFGRSGADGAGADASAPLSMPSTGAAAPGAGINTAFASQTSDMQRAVASELAQCCSEMLEKVFRQHTSVRDEILGQILSRVLTRDESVKYVVQLLATIASGCSKDVLDCLPKIKESLEYLAFMPPTTALALIRALQPVLRLSSSLLDYLIIILRKALFSREEDARMVALQGFLLLAQGNLGSVRGEAGNAGRSDARGIVGGIVEDPLALEMIGQLRRTMAQQVQMREKLYDGLCEVVQAKPYLIDDVAGALFPQLQRYCQTDGSGTRIVLEKCVDGSNVIVEPIGKLLRAVAVCVALKTKTSAPPSIGTEGVRGKEAADDHESSVIGAARSMLDKLSVWIADADPEDFDMDKETDFSNTETQHLSVARLLVGMHEVLFEHTMLNPQVKVGHEKRLFKGIRKMHAILDLVSTAKPASKSGSKGRGKGSSLLHDRTSLFSYDFARRLLVGEDTGGAAAGRAGEVDLTADSERALRKAVFDDEDVMSLALETAQRQMIEAGRSIANTAAQHGCIKGDRMHVIRLAPLLLRQFYVNLQSKRAVVTLDHAQLYKGRKASPALDKEKEGEMSLIALHGLQMCVQLACTHLTSAELGEMAARLADEFVAMAAKRPGSVAGGSVAQVGAILPDAGGSYEDMQHDAALVDTRIAHCLNRLQHLCRQVLEDEEPEYGGMIADTIYIFQGALSLEAGLEHEAWAQDMCKKPLPSGSEHQGLSKALVANLLRLTQCEQGLDSLIAIGNDMQILFRLEDDEEERRSQAPRSPEYDIVREDTRDILFSLTTEAVKACCEDVEWVCDSLELHARPDLTENDDTKDSPEVEAMVSDLNFVEDEALRRLHRGVDALLPLARCLENEYGNKELVIKALTRVYRAAEHVAKKVEQRKAVGVRKPFIQLMVCIGTHLNDALYELLLRFDVAAEDKARGKRQKITNESRLVPALVYQVEMLEAHLIKIQKAQGNGKSLDLMKHFKRSTARDFKIDYGVAFKMTKDEEDQDVKKDGKKKGKGKKRKEGDSENGSANTQASKRSRR